MTLSHLPGPAPNLTPGHAQLPAIKILHHDNFLPPIKLVPRHCAIAIFATSSTGTISRPFIKLVPRPRLHAIKFVPGPPSLKLRRAKTAKSTPYLSCTGTISRLKYQDPARMLRQVTQPPFIAGPLGNI